jgi:acyl-CoA thioesterase
MSGMSQNEENVPHEIIYSREKNSTFTQLIGLKIEMGEPGRAIGHLEVGPQHFQPEGAVHGGVIFSIADTVAGLSLRSITRLEKRLATVEAKINLLAPTFGGELVAEGHVTHRGKTLAVTEVNVYNIPEPGKEKKRVAIFLATFMMLPLPSQTTQ